MKEINIIVAASTKYGIGYDNKMCWHIPDELNNFKKITTGNTDKMNCVIMGKNTWNSLPNGALKNRLNIVLSKVNSKELSEKYSDKNVIIMEDIEKVFEYLDITNDVNDAFIIGGSQLYNNILSNYIHKINKIYLSIIYDKDYECNKFINSDDIYKNFKFDKENIHMTERYAFMIGYNKNLSRIRDESPL